MNIASFTTWCELPTKIGIFRMYDMQDEKFRLISFSDINNLCEAPLIRIHSSCMASEVFKALDCDCADQLESSMKLIAKEKEGIIFHLHQEGRGHGLSSKIKAVQLMQNKNIDTVEAFNELDFEHDIRTYKKVTDLLSSLGITKVRVITNNPRKIKYLELNGIKVVEKVSLIPKIRAENRDYLYSKNEKLSHSLVLS
ncbi:MAG: GTP cyclohydrolase II RibA [Campylobacteraceae bacterium]|nr:GTP cyclohydrolase II RibA [Campylobacteraceae bacterium]